MTDTITVPEGYTEEHANYLLRLRDSGVVNMFGAGEYVQDEFGLSKRDARDYLTYWMQSFEG